MGAEIEVTTKDFHLVLQFLKVFLQMQFFFLVLCVLHYSDNSLRGELRICNTHPVNTGLKQNGGSYLKPFVDEQA